MQFPQMQLLIVGVINVSVPTGANLFFFLGVKSLPLVLFFITWK